MCKTRKTRLFHSESSKFGVVLTHAGTHRNGNSYPKLFVEELSIPALKAPYCVKRNLANDGRCAPTRVKSRKCYMPQLVNQGKTY